MIGRAGWVLGVVGLCLLGCSDDTSGSGGDGGDDSYDGPTYCDVEPITHRYCTRCHADPPDGAPFPLVTYADTQLDHGSRKRYEVMAAMVESESMPPVSVSADPPVEAPSEDERDIIIDWADAGAPSGGCE